MITSQASKSIVFLQVTLAKYSHAGIGQPLGSKPEKEEEEEEE